MGGTGREGERERKDTKRAKRTGEREVGGERHRDGETEKEDGNFATGELAFPGAPVFPGVVKHSPPSLGTQERDRSRTYTAHLQ